MAFVKVPVIRGIKEISTVLAATQDTGCYIFGGYARYCCSQRTKYIPKAGDLDIYAPNKGGFDAMWSQLQHWGFTKKHESNVALTLAYLGEDIRFKLMPNVQLIKPVERGAIVAKGSLERILSNFDFTVIRIGLLGTDWALADEDFVEDEKKLRISIKNIHCPISSTIRCMKYAKKGYYIRPTEMMKLFQDWDARPPEYREDIIGLLERVVMLKEQGKKLTDEEVDKLRWLLYFD